MSDATVAAAASVVVAVITAVVGPALLARYKAHRAESLRAPSRAGARSAARPGPRPVPRALRLHATGLTTAGLTHPGHGRARRPDHAPPRVVLRERGPRAVIGRLAEIPPLSRRAVAHELFVDRWAEWGGVVRDVREGGSGYEVEVVDPDDGGTAVLDFPADERPVLESLREGDRVRYVGRVTGAEDGLVTLDSPTISRAD